MSIIITIIIIIIIVINSHRKRKEKSAITVNWALFCTVYVNTQKKVLSNLKCIFTITGSFWKMKTTTQ